MDSYFRLLLEEKGHRLTDFYFHCKVKNVPRGSRNTQASQGSEPRRCGSAWEHAVMDSAWLWRQSGQDLLMESVLEARGRGQESRGFRQSSRTLCFPST